MNAYQKDQYQTYCEVIDTLQEITSPEIQKIKNALSDYFTFRNLTDQFLGNHFAKVCNLTCYESRLSACCSRDGVIIFFADVVINLLMSSSEETESLLATLRIENNGFKCIYLGKSGCLWHIKPIVCQMFLCDQAEREIFKGQPELSEEWNLLKKRKMEFTWPDRPVLFDDIEQRFMKAGCSSPLMYYHKSPGLLRIKNMNR